MTMTAVSFHKKLMKAINKPDQQVRKHDAMKTGRKGHQGDVYVHRIDAIPGVWNVLVEGRQVALGHTTGSRHCADGDGIKVLWPDSKPGAAAACPIKEMSKKIGNSLQFIMGPCVDAPNGFTLTHPEHAHHEFPAGKYLVTYQLDHARQRQVQD